MTKASAGPPKMHNVFSFLNQLLYYYGSQRDIRSILKMQETQICSSQDRAPDIFWY